MFAPVSCPLPPSPFLLLGPPQNVMSVCILKPFVKTAPAARSQQPQILTREQQLASLGYSTTVDAPNRIATPKESFVASEGIYTLREEVTLSIPPPHPSEPLIGMPNPIATNPLPVTAGTQACIINAGVSRQTSSADSASIASGISGNSTTSDSIATAAGIYAPLILKRKKPKNNIAKTNSTFVSRIITHEHLQKRITDRKSDEIFAFVNIARAYEWLDFSGPDKVIESFLFLPVTEFRQLHLPN
jgi:hypothetical protein